MNKPMIFFAAIIAAVLMSFNSCKQQENPVAKPLISNLELGLKNSRQAYIGTDLHMEAEIVAEGKIDKIIVEIHPEAGGGKEIKEEYSEFSGQKNVNFHKHIDIPNDAKVGEYHLHFTVIDQLGNSTSKEAELVFKELVDNEKPTISITSAPKSGQKFSKGESIRITGQIKDDAVLSGMLIALVKKSDNIADEDVRGRNESIIVMKSTHDLDSPNSHTFDVSIVVGAEKDNRSNPRPISGKNAWRSGEYYIVVKTADLKGNVVVSEHYPLVLNVM